jgi:hypothetical protein
MRSTCLPVIVVGFGVFVGGQGVAGQGTGRVGPLPRAEAVALNDLIDDAAEGKGAGGDAWLKWNSHFMRAADGRVYVPFTVTLDDADAGFESIAMYVRVMPRGTKGPVGRGRVSGSDMATPVSAPERQFSRGNPTAGEASARLGLMATELGSVRPPFEGFFVARMPATASPPIVRRSLVVAPGDYDLYVAVRERPGSGSRAAPKGAVLRHTLSVPDLGGNEPVMSSVILADRIDALAKRLSPSQQADRPYAFGSTEIFPAADATFAQDDVLSVVFFVYNLAVDKANLPDVTVEYRFRQMSSPAKVFGELVPQRLSRAHTTPAFDAKAGHQLAVTQALPLTTFPRDNYELEISVTDNLSGHSIQRAVRFTVG